MEIEHERRRKKHTKKDLARSAGIRQVTLSSILGGKSTKWSTAREMADTNGSSPMIWADGYTAYMARVVDTWMYDYGDAENPASDDAPKGAYPST